MGAGHRTQQCEQVRNNVRGQSNDKETSDRDGSNKSIIEAGCRSGGVVQSEQYGADGWLV